MSCKSCGSNGDLVKHGESHYCGTCRELGLHAGLSSSNNDLDMADKALEMADKALERIDYDDRVKAMVIVTDASVARKTVIETLGFVTGSTVRAKHVGSDIMAGLKSVVGGELKGYTELLANGRDEAIYRLKQDASKLGADAVISMRLTTSMIAAGAVEIMAYGTAVKFAEEV